MKTLWNGTKLNMKAVFHKQFPNKTKKKIKLNVVVPKIKAQFECPRFD